MVYQLRLSHKDGLANDRAWFVTRSGGVTAGDVKTTGTVGAAGPVRGAPRSIVCSYRASEFRATLNGVEFDEDVLKAHLIE